MHQAGPCWLHTQSSVQSSDSAGLWIILSPKMQRFLQLLLSKHLDEKERKVYNALPYLRLEFIYRREQVFFPAQHQTPNNEAEC